MRVTWSSISGRIAVLLVLGAALAPGASAAAVGCDDGPRQPRRMVGTYVPTSEPYARSFAFAMQVTCHGKQEMITVQRATGNLPVCEAGQEVELTGTIVWNRFLMDGHYEINNPTGVTCRMVALAATPAAPSPPPAAVTTPPSSVATPSAPAPPPPAAAPPPAVTAPPSSVTTPAAPAPAPMVSAVTPAVWSGRYQDSRGGGTITFSLVRGTSMVSGTWKARTGGGGPVTGRIEADGRRIELRMENVARECPGALEGTGEITDTALTVSYRGSDCEGSITDGRLELRAQPARP
jgi:hypothetical protein